MQNYHSTRSLDLQLHPEMYSFQAAFCWTQAINGAELLYWNFFTNVVVFSKTNKHFPYKNVLSTFNFICVHFDNLNTEPRFTLLNFTFIQQHTPITAKSRGFTKRHKSLV